MILETSDINSSILMFTLLGICVGVLITYVRIRLSLSYLVNIYSQLGEKQARGVKENNETFVQDCSKGFPSL